MNKLSSLLKLGNTPYSAISTNSINLKTCTRNYGTSRIKKVPINNKPERELSKRFTSCKGYDPCSKPVKQQNVKKEEQICRPPFNYETCKAAKKIAKTDKCDIIMAKSCESNPCQFGCINAPTTECTNVCPKEQLPPVPKGNWKKSNP